MQNFTFATGKNVEQAIENGLKELGLTRDDVTIEIINEGGLFSKAKVKLTADEKATKTEVKKEVSKMETLMEESPKFEMKAPTFKKSGEGNFKQSGEAPSGFKKSGENNFVKPEPIKVEELLAEPEPVIKEHEPLTETTEKEYPQITFAKKLLAEMGYNEIEITAKANSHELYIDVTGEKLGALIGREGETLDNLQTLIGAYKVDRELNRRIFLDVGGYKKQKDAKLCEYADQMAGFCIKDEEVKKLRAMNAYERRVIHNHLQNNPNVRTISKGEGKDRHLLILPKRI